MLSATAQDWQSHNASNLIYNALDDLVKLKPHTHTQKYIKTTKKWRIEGVERLTFGINIQRYLSFSCSASLYIKAYDVQLENVSTQYHGSKENINNGNRTEWSPIRSIIIRVINKIGRPRSGSPICLITSMITDRIGWHEVLLPINHIYNKIRERKRRKRTGEGIDNSFILRNTFLKKAYSSVTDPLARALWRVLSNYLGMTRTLSNYTVLLSY